MNTYNEFEIVEIVLLYKLNIKFRDGLSTAYILITNPSHDITVVIG